MKTDYFNETAKGFDLNYWQSILHYTIGTFGKKKKYTTDEKFIKVLSYYLDTYHPEAQDISGQSEHNYVLVKFVLQHLATIKKDENDIFGRYVVDVSNIPAADKRQMIREYVFVRKCLDKFSLYQLLNPSDDENEQEGQAEQTEQ